MATSEQKDHQLIQQALSGEKSALELLLKNHQVWIFNVALNLTADANEAADLMQEVMIKIVTNLSKFQFKSEFRTWVYRIIRNHFLNTRRSKYDSQIIPWEEYGNGLDSIKNEDLIVEQTVDREQLVQEAKLSCMKGMLLCLDPEQRLVFVMGELFEIPDSQACLVLEISKDNFRKKLSRARGQLYGFMENKCGLINKNNPCRCARKTKGFIARGYVDPDNLQFQKNIISTIEESLKHKLAAMKNDVDMAYKKLYQNHFLMEPEDRLDSLKRLMSSDTIKKTFDLQ